MFLSNYLFFICP